MLAGWRFGGFVVLWFCGDWVRWFVLWSPSLWRSSSESVQSHGRLPYDRPLSIWVGPWHDAENFSIFGGTGPAMVRLRDTKKQKGERDDG